MVFEFIKKLIKYYVDKFINWLRMKRFNFELDQDIKKYHTNLDKKIKENQKKIDDILSKYEGVTAEDIKDVVGKAFILENYTADIAFA